MLTTFTFQDIHATRNQFEDEVMILFNRLFFQM